jgi:signal transduction histidine kinase
VRGERAGNDIRLSVSDDGPGVPAAMLEAIFG